VGIVDKNGGSAGISDLLHAAWDLRGIGERGDGLARADAADAGVNLRLGTCASDKLSRAKRRSFRTPGSRSKFSTNSRKIGDKVCCLN
jgi:hypothetical protein